MALSRIYRATFFPEEEDIAILTEVLDSRDQRFILVAPDIDHTELSQELERRIQSKGNLVYRQAGPVPLLLAHGLVRKVVVCTSEALCKHSKTEN